MTWHQDQFTINTDKQELDIDYIHDFISKSYWAENVPMDIVKRSIENSMCFAVYDGAKQIGFARVITDKATFGYLADVFIDERYRGKKLGVWLIETIMSHPELQGFRNWFLATRDAHGLYSKFGFRQLEQPERIMRKNDPDVYKTSDSF